VKRRGLALEIGAAVLLAPLVVWGGAAGALAYFGALCLLAALGVRREIAGPLERLQPARDADG
jgi:hypothetical protein